VQLAICIVKTKEISFLFKFLSLHFLSFSAGQGSWPVAGQTISINNKWRALDNPG